MFKYYFYYNCEDELLDKDKLLDKESDNENESDDKSKFELELESTFLNIFFAILCFLDFFDLFDFSDFPDLFAPPSKKFDK